MAGPRPATAEPAAAPIAPKPAAAAVAAKPAAHAAPAVAAPSATPTGVVEGNEQVQGRIELAAGPGQQIAAGEITNTIVYFVPARGAPRPNPGRYSIVTRNKRFEPEVLVVPAGSTVSFPNQDEILHNVYSPSTGAGFDLGLYGEGQSAETVFNRATVVQIFCNVHHSMHADVLVAPTPWFARVDGEGRFALTGLPPGPGTLSLWHPRSGMIAREISLPLAAPLLEKLLATKPVIPEHQRKDGASYRPPAR